MVPEPKEKRNRLNPGEKANLSSLVEYQPGSVVSRTIVESKAGTVRIFAFGEGEGLSEHTSPQDALVFILDGEAAVTIAGKESLLMQSEGIILPAGKPHSLYAPKRFKMLLTMIRPS
jgi:quercetin dioxygenase-like cupin family protein